MRYFSAFFAVCFVALLASVAGAQRTPVNEWKSTTPDYTVVGSGINREISPGVFVESDPTIDFSNPNQWACDTVGSPWFVNKSNQRLSITRGGAESEIQPDTLYWFNAATWELTEAASQQVPTETNTETTITLTEALQGVDAEIVSEVSGISFDYIINDTSAWTPNPYPEADSYLVMRYQLTKTEHTITMDGAAVNWDGMAGDNIRFAGPTGDMEFVSVLAQDANGLDHPIKYFLIRSTGKNWFLEGLPVADFNGLTLPVRYHYTSVSGTMTTDDDWTSGTYCVVDHFYTGAYVLTVSGGVVVKTAVAQFIVSGGGDLIIDASAENRAIFTTCADTTAGDPDTQDETNCTRSVGNGAWQGIAYLSDGADADRSIVGMECRYAGFNTAIDACLDMDTQRQSGSILITDSVFYEYGSASYQYSSGIRIDSDASDPVSILVERNYFYNSGVQGNVSTALAVWTNSSTNASTTSIVRNNLFVHDGAWPTYTVFLYGGANVRTQFENNTTAGSNASSTNPEIYLRVADYKYNVFVGSERIINTSSTHDYNICYNFIDGDVGCDETNESYSNPVFSEHSHSGDVVPTWADDFHVDASTSPAVDAADITSTTQGLNLLHATDDGIADSGDLDFGHHYPVFAEAGGGIGAHFYRRHMQ